jgi:hypothetical protein
MDLLGQLTSRSLSADTSVHLNSACPPLVPPLVGSNIVPGHWSLGELESVVTARRERLTIQYLHLFVSTV